MDKFGGEPGSDNASTLEMCVKDYRKLILENGISEFDFRKYLFARQSELRFMLHRPWDVASGALLFIKMLSRDLQKKKPPSEETRNFAISWVFSSCMCILEACQAAAKAMKFGELTEKSQQTKDLSPQASNFFLLSAALGDLTNYSRIKLKHLGQIYNLLRAKAEGTALFNQEYSSVSTPMALETFINRHQEASRRTQGYKGQENEQKGLDGVEEQKGQLTSPEIPGITNPTLLRALRSQTDFDQIYLDVSKQAVRFYKTSRRKRSKKHVREEIADLYLARGEYASAEALYKSLCQPFSKERWPLLEDSLYSKLAHCQFHQQDYTGFLQSTLLLLSIDIPIRRTSKESHLHTLCDVAHNRVGLGVELPMGQVFKVLSVEAIHNLSLGQTLSIDVVIYSNLSLPISCEGLRISFMERKEPTSVPPTPKSPQPQSRSRFHTTSKPPPPSSKALERKRSRSLLGRPEEENASLAARAIVFKHGNVSLVPGKNELKLGKKINREGRFQLSIVEVIIGQLSLYEKFEEIPEKDRLEVVVQEKERSLEVTISQPATYLLTEQPQHLLVTVNTKQESFVEASILVSSSALQLNPSALTAVITSADGEERELTLTKVQDDSPEFQLPQCEEQTTILLFVSVLATPDSGTTHQVTAKLSYETIDGRKVDAGASGEFTFVRPFSSKISVIPFGSRLCIQVIIRCELVWARFKGHRLLCAGHQMLADDINALLLGQGLVKNQEISLVFQLDQDSSDKSNCGEAKLEIDYQLIDDATTKPLVFTCPIHLDAQKHLYEVQLEHADSAVVGSAIHVALHIIRLASSSQEEEDPVFEVTSKEPWIVLGLRKAHFNLHCGERRTWHFKLLSTSPGYLPVPFVMIHGVPPDKVRCMHTAKQIHVLPKEMLFSCFARMPREGNEAHTTNSSS